ncbi:hypothetical protein J3R83DRAFT_7707, partial [Lanmaoa asiatica]
MADVSPTTPQSKPQLLPEPDTAPKLRATSQSGYRSGDLTLGRAAVLTDLEKYLSVPCHTLVYSIFGDYTQDIPQTRQKLIDANVLTLSNARSQWTRFSVTPGESGDKEDTVFKPLVNIVSKIFEQVSSCKLTYQAVPSVTLLSARGNTSRPDAYISYKRDGASSKTHWWDIAIPFEFKKKNNLDAKQDNEAKIIWSLHNMMREDPCRRFALGITIEDKDMRIWCHNRAFLVASKPLDFTKEIDAVIALFYSIACQDEAGLGWDPTVERVYDGDKVLYKFTIDGEVFTTIGELATYGADAIFGRGTRVYKAKDKDGRVVAIKDSWRDHDRDTEGATLEKIFNDIKAKFGQQGAEDARKYFVQVRVSKDVEIFGKLDTTLAFTGLDKLEWIDVDVKHALSTKLHTPSTGHIESNRSPVIPRGKVGARYTQELPMKVHTRTAFKDVGKPLKDVARLGDSFKCLDGARQALSYLHKSGWVHRDFSVTNVLWFEEAKIGKLSDLEYAKKFDAGTTHDVRTVRHIRSGLLRTHDWQGTMQFMAIEVESRCYHFKPDWNGPRGTLFYPDDDVFKDPPFRTNFLHDLESSWWAVIWILFQHTDADSPTTTPDDQLRCATEAFPPTIAQALRHYFFTDGHVLQKAFETLSSTYKEQYKPFVPYAVALQELYKRAEKSYPNIVVNDELVDDAHAKTKEIYSVVAKALEGSAIRLQLLSIKRGPEGSPTNAKGPKKSK